jgi:hypothetical protein
VAAVPLWVQLLLMEECRVRIEQALCGPVESRRSDHRRASSIIESPLAALPSRPRAPRSAPEHQYDLIGECELLTQL